ncbi:MAG: sulfotransferase [Kiritimatiellales bacterium]|nr:sulfotransferase [Pontiella sp.]NNJ71535.1 sulfotransferase [Kiritimatiellales bacterium]
MSRFDSAVYIAGVARSGTSWIGQIFNSCPSVRFRFQPLFAYEFKNQVNEDSSPADFQNLLDGIYESTGDFLLQKDKVEAGVYPQFTKENETTLVFKENRYQSFIEPMMRKLPEVALLGVLRHPCAVLNSWKNNAKEFPAECDIRKEWRFGNCKNTGNEDYFGYYKWKEVAHLYLDLKDKYPDRTYVLRYEDLVQDPLGVAGDLFNFFNIPLTDQTREFLEASTSASQASYYSVYKTSDVTEKWKTDLDPSIAEEILADLSGTRLERFAQ